MAFTAAGAGSSTSTLSNVALQSGNPVYALVAGTTTVVVNSAPVASAGTLTAVEDGSGTTTLVATDANGDALTYTAGNGTNGTVTVAGAVATYTPNADFSGTDSFTFTANDGQTDSAAGTITVTVTAVNDAPVSSAGTLTTNEDTAGTVTLAATDVDGDALTYTASNGT
ncbi:MAG: cadherin-like domain-containing protein, partial [Bacteroidetes Order II. Incertae sedis bacterium]|nr:cadherin-like domain-containing protein [Bacteroidetes Order II. bacterium]